MNRRPFTALEWVPARNGLLTLTLILAALCSPPPAQGTPLALSSDARALQSPIHPAAANIQPEIEALAAGLDNNPAFIYGYLLNNYDAVPAYGQLKSPRETALSRTGTPFDLVALLGDLLRASGYEVQYVLGIVKLPADKAANWIGADTPQIAQQVLDAGGTYSEVAGDVLRVKHPWLRVRIQGTWYPLDPSWKAYAYTKGMSLGSILGYSRDAHMAAALNGATVTADYVDNLNVANVESRLGQYSTNLLKHLRENAPFASLAQVVGGRSIVTQTITALPRQLPYAVERELGTWSELPRDSTYQLRIELPGAEVRAFLPDISGERMTITYAGATDADRAAIAAAGGIDKVYPAYQVKMVPELRVGGKVVATGSAVPLGSTAPVTVTVETPYMIGDNRVVWRLRPRVLTVGAFYAIPMSLEGTCEKTLQQHRQLLSEYRAAGLPEQSEPVRGESLYLLGASYFNEVEASGRLTAALARVIYVQTALAAFTSQNLLVAEWVSDGSGRQPARVAWGSVHIDVIGGQRTIRSASGDAQSERAFSTHLEEKASAAEHAVIEQLQNTPAISTVKALALAQETHTRVYRLTPATVESLLPALEQPLAIKDQLRQSIAEGRIIIVPQRTLVSNSWQGTGYWSYDPRSGKLDGLIPGQTAPQGVQVLPGQPMMGGDSTVLQEIVSSLLDSLIANGPGVGTGCNPGCNDANGTNNAGSDPVDTATGAFVHATTDLAFGVLGYPIRFKRTYVSDRRNAGGPLGSGWTHNYAMRLDISSDWARGLGFRTALDAVAAIAEAYVDLDLARATTGELTLDRILVGTAGANWSTTQVINNAVTATGPDGSRHQYLRLPDGTYQPGHHDYSKLVANADGTHTLVDRAGGRMEFDAHGRAVALVDANGNRTSLTCDEHGRLIRVTDAAGRAIDLTYTGELLTQIVDPAQRIFRYGYDAKSNLTSFTDPLGGVTRYTYDDERRLVSLIDAEGVVFTTNTYDDWSRVTRQVDGRGGTMTMAYGDIRTVVTHPLGNRTTYFYDRYQRLVGQADNDGSRSSVTYDANDNVLRMVSRGGEVTGLAYNAGGRVTQTADALKRTTTWTYDERQDLVAVRRPSGQTTRMTYDERHNLLRVVDALGNSTNYACDVRGLITGVTDPNGHTVSMDYDLQGNLVKVTDALGNATTLTYDTLGRVLSSQDALGHATQYAYDAKGRVVSRTDPLGNATAYTYDRNGLPLTFRDARGNTTRFGYDTGYNLSQVTDGTGGVTRYEYDLNQHLVGVTDANGHVTRYERDAMGRAVRIADPLNRPTALAFDRDGRLVSRTRADGHVIRYEYDAVGRLSKTLYSDARVVTSEYDVDGRLVSLDDGAWKALYTYDAAGRPAQTALPGQGLALTYGYDAAGNRVTLRAQRASTVLYDARWTYDAANRVTKAIDATNNYALTYAYDADGTVKTLAHSSGARAGYAYDAAHRVTRIDQRDAQGTALSVFDYVYDAAGNPTRITRATREGSLITDYAYDALDRLVRESSTRHAIEYAYDPVGNRTRVTSPAGTVDYAYDAADQLLTAGTLRFAYDANGNQVRRGDHVFAYDDNDRLTRITAPSGVITTYRYDPVGRRIGSQGSSDSTEFVHDGMNVILDGSAGLSQGTAYLWARGHLTAARRLSDAGSAVGYLGDRLGSVTYVIDAGRSPASDYGYDAFGQAQDVPRASAEPYRFVGQSGVRAEPALSDLYLMGLRYYDAAVGRFLTRDLLNGDDARPQTRNRYAYSLNNPLRYLDPLGLRPNNPWESYGMTDTDAARLQQILDQISDPQRKARHERDALELRQLMPESTSDQYWQMYAALGSYCQRVGPCSGGGGSSGQPNTLQGYLTDSSQSDYEAAQTSRNNLQTELVTSITERMREDERVRNAVAQAEQERQEWGQVTSQVVDNFMQNLLTPP